jgi:hypothetical protein
VERWLRVERDKRTFFWPLFNVMTCGQRGLSRLFYFSRVKDDTQGDSARDGPFGVIKQGECGM